MFYGKFKRHPRKLFVSILCLVSNVSSANSITQFENFTIEWLDFSIFTCAVSSTISVSLFTCVNPNYTQIADVSCLIETTIDFQESTCQPNTTVNILLERNISKFKEKNLVN